MRTHSQHSGVALAVGTNPAVEVSVHPPQNASVDEVKLMGPILDEQLAQIIRGTTRVELQPGDLMVSQFVLRTRQWLSFTPLMHKFEIQITYESDGIPHGDTVAYDQNICSTLSAICVGSAVGAIFGSLLKSFSASPVSANTHSVLQGLFVSVLASTAVVVAFARKTNAQPIISIEDFWGGALLGFTVGFFGFDRFSGLFTGTAK